MDESDRNSDSWAQDILSLMESDGKSLGSLVAAARLDPSTDDLKEVDLSNLDLSRTDMVGWRLGSADLSGTNLENANLTGSMVDPISLALSENWQSAELDIETYNATKDASIIAAMLIRVTEVTMSVRTTNCLKNDGITLLGQLAKKTEAELLRTPNFGRKSVNEVKEFMSRVGLHIGMKIPKSVDERYLQVDQEFQTMGASEYANDAGSDNGGIAHNDELVAEEKLLREMMKAKS